MKNAKRAGDLIGYLLRKKRQLANYAERHAHGDWIASTRGGNVVWPEYRRSLCGAFQPASGYVPALRFGGRGMVALTLSDDFSAKARA